MNPGLKGNPSGRFLGVNLRQDRVSLADQDVAKAINADLHSQPGVIVLRLGRTAHNESALSDLAIRRLAKINGYRYQVAGQRLYCSYTLITGVSTLHANLITTLMGFRPLNDTTTWAFVADDSTMYKLDCSTRGFWGVGTPGTVPHVIAGTTPGFTGTFTFQYTRVRLVDSAVAAEGNPSIAVTLTVTNESLTIGDLEDVAASNPTLNAVGIYRSVANTTVPLLVAYYSIPSTSAYSLTHTWEVDTLNQSGLTLQWALNLGTETISGSSSANTRGTHAWEPSAATNSEDAAGRRGTYLWEQTDGYVTTQTKYWAKHLVTADSGLGAIVEVDNDPPPVASWVVEHQGHAFLCRDAANPHYLWFSKRFQPDAFPQENFLEIGNPDDPLQCAVPIAGTLGVFARKTKYRVLGNITTGFVAEEAASHRGTPCPMATIATEYGIVFIARDGIFSTFLSSQDVGFAEKILPMFFGETVNDMAYLNWEVPNTFSAAVYKGRYYFSYAETGHSTPNRMAVYSRDTKNWYHYDHPMRALFVEEDTDLFMGGGLDGFVYMLA